MHPLQRAIFRVSCGLVLVPGAITSANAGNEAETPPNLIVVLADDMRTGYTGFEGHPVIRTPNLDQLAAEGVVFTNAFATSAVCTPSRTSLLTGLFERRHGINFNSNSSMSNEAYARTYPMLLKNAGYFVGYIGKNHTPVGKNEAGVVGYDSGVMDNSFDYWYAGHKHLGFYPKDKNPGVFTNANADTQIEIMEEGMENFFTPDSAFQGSYDFLQSRPGDKPFALLLNFNVPHGYSTGGMELRESDPALYRTTYRDEIDQLELPSTYIAGKDIVTPKIPASVYNGEYLATYNYVKTPDDLIERDIRTIQTISGVDKLLGKLLDKLEEQGVAGNTIIVFTSDHGLLHGEHGLGGKVLLYEPSIGIPLVVHDPRPGGAAAVSESDDLVALVDIAPTLLELSGVPVPQAMQGKSLVPLMQGNGSGWREALFLENNLTDQDYPRMEAVRTRQWKYVRYFDKANDQEYADMLVASINGEQPIYEELFDLANDPTESHNVISDPKNSDILEQLRTRNAALVAGYRGTQPLDTIEVSGDLVVKSVSMDDRLLTWNAPFAMVEANIRNKGPGWSSLTHAGFYVSTDATISVGDRQVGDVEISRLAQGASVHIEHQVGVDEPGDYWAGVCITPMPDEANPANNCSSGVRFTLERVGADPYEPDNSRDQATVIENGKPQTHNIVPVQDNDWYRFDLINPSDIKLRLVSDASNHAVMDFYHGQSLVQGNSALIELADMHPGTYYILVRHQTGDDIIEEYVLDLETVSLANPDSVVKSAAVDRSAVDRGESFDLSVTVQNQGDGASPSSRVLYYLSSDSAIETTDTQIAIDEIGPMAPGETTTLKTSVRAPWISGAYYLGACVAPVPDELEIQNNCSGSVELNVSTNPVADQYENDNTPARASFIRQGESQPHSIYPVSDVDWVRLSLARMSKVVVETRGGNGDTSLWVYDSHMNAISFNHDRTVSGFTSISTDYLQPGDYYIKVREKDDSQEISAYFLQVNAIAKKRQQTLYQLLD